MLDTLYSQALVKYASTITREGTLLSPHGRVSLTSKPCGSSIHVDLNVRNGYIVDFAQTVQSCALGRASASILGENIIGCTFEDLQLGYKTLQAVLGKNILHISWYNVSQLWPNLSLFSVAQNAPERHNSIFLPFKVTCQALDLALK